MNAATAAGSIAAEALKELSRKRTTDKIGIGWRGAFAFESQRAEADEMGQRRSADDTF